MRTRPLSPHLQIYKPQLTTVLSILHRATGVFLSFGTLLLCAILFALASGRESYQNWLLLSRSLVGTLLLLGWTFSLVYHSLNGIRHLIWDCGWWLDLRSAYASGWTVVVLSFTFTAALWFFAQGAAV